MKKSDPMFGALFFMGDKAGYWEGTTYFEPVGHEIEVFIDGSAWDSMADQREFFRKLIDNWSRLVPAIKAAIVAAGHAPPAVPLAISAVSIPKATIFNNAEWSVSVEAPRGGTYTVNMRGAVAQSASWDC